MSFHFGSSLSLGLVFALSPFLFLFLLFLHADALAFIFFGPSFDLPEFFFFFGLRALAFVQNVLALRVGLAALSCSLAGFEAMFWVEWVGADATGRNNSRGGVLLARTSVQSRPSPLHSRGVQAALSPSRQPCSSLGRRDGWRPE